MAEPWLLKHTVIALRKLCEVSTLYPTCYVLEGIKDISSKSGGGFCDIQQGRYGEQMLCLKVVRLYQKSNIEQLLKAHAREAILWSQLDHPNIVPFYGIFYRDRMERVCLVSPWMKNGDIVEYLERVPDAPRKLFVYDIANGLQYLHDRDIIHGDLKGRNVLIDDSQKARLADFGLSTIVTDQTLGFTRTTVAASGHTARWTSPELLEDDARPTYQSDLWAFGCVCYEVLTGLLPFTGYSDIKVLSKLMKGELPADLDNTRLDPDNDFSRKLCTLVRRCWLIEPRHRPACQVILRALEEVIVIQQSHGPSLESYTTRNSLIHFQAWLTTPAAMQVEQATNLLEKIYNANEKTRARSRHTPFFKQAGSLDPPSVLAVAVASPSLSENGNRDRDKRGAEQEGIKKRQQEAEVGARAHEMRHWEEDKQQDNEQDGDIPQTPFFWSHPIQLHPQEGKSLRFAQLAASTKGHGLLEAGRSSSPPNANGSNGSQNAITVTEKARIWVCEKCGDSFSQRNSLNRHLRNPDACKLPKHQHKWLTKRSILYE